MLKRMAFWGTFGVSKALVYVWGPHKVLNANPYMENTAGYRVTFRTNLVRSVGTPPGPTLNDQPKRLGRATGREGGGNVPKSKPRDPLKVVSAAVCDPNPPRPFARYRNEPHPPQIYCGFSLRLWEKNNRQIHYGGACL